MSESSYLIRSVVDYAIRRSANSGKVLIVPDHEYFHSELIFRCEDHDFQSEYSGKHCGRPWAISASGNPHDVEGIREGGFIIPGVHC